MPTIQTAKVIVGNALATIGAWPAVRSAPDPGDLKRGLQWLEMLLNFKSAVRPVGGFFKIIDIPIEALVGDYDLNDYLDDGGSANDIFTVNLVSANGEVSPLVFEYENEAVTENLQTTGQPERATVTRDRDMVLRVFPTPTQTQQDAGLVLRVRLKIYSNKIDTNGNGTGDVDVMLRPSWYLWATKMLGYELGCGPVRRLPEGELKRLQDDAMALENALLAHDAKVHGKPPVTEPMAMSVDDDLWQSDIGAGSRRGYFKR